MDAKILRENGPRGVRSSYAVRRYGESSDGNTQVSLASKPDASRHWTWDLPISQPWRRFRSAAGDSTGHQSATRVLVITLLGSRNAVVDGSWDALGISLNRECGDTLDRQFDAARDKREQMFNP